MTLALIATPGASDANTYATLAEAEAYQETRLHNSTWTAATTANKNAALVWATRLLDELVDWYGYRAASTQALRFPRSGLVDMDGWSVDYTIIPQWLKNATAEFAMHLLDKDRVKDSDLKGFSSVKVASIRLNVDKYDTPKFIPPSVWEMISHYGERRSAQIKMLVKG